MTNLPSRQMTIDRDVNFNNFSIIGVKDLEIKSTDLSKSGVFTIDNAGQLSYNFDGGGSFPLIGADGSIVGVGGGFDVSGTGVTGTQSFTSVVIGAGLSGAWAANVLTLSATAAEGVGIDGVQVGGVGTYTNFVLGTNLTGTPSGANYTLNSKMATGTGITGGTAFESLALGTNMAGTITGGILTLTSTASGGGGGVTTVEGLAGAVDLAGGTGISIAASGSTVTITNTQPHTSAYVIKTAGNTANSALSQARSLLATDSSAADLKLRKIYGGNGITVAQKTGSDVDTLEVAVVAALSITSVYASSTLTANGTINGGKLESLTGISGTYLQLTIRSNAYDQGAAGRISLSLSGSVYSLILYTGSGFKMLNFV